MSAFQDIYDSFYCYEDEVTMSFIQAQHKKIRLIQWGAIAYPLAVVVFDYYTRNLGKPNFYTALFVCAWSLIFLEELRNLKIPRSRFKTRNSALMNCTLGEQIFLVANSLINEQLSVDRDTAHAFLRAWIMGLACVTGIVDEEMLKVELVLMSRRMNCVHKKLQKVIRAINLILSFMSAWYGMEFLMVVFATINK